MRPTTTRTAAAALALMLAGCGSDEGAVKDAATAYAEAIESGDAADAKKVMTDRCDEIANGITLSAMSSEVGDDGFTIDVVSVDGDTAEVDVDFVAIEGTGDPAVFRKVGDAWLFDGCP